jgi:hypothetical protein
VFHRSYNQPVIKQENTGDIAAIITVLVFPPKESYNNLVNLESLKSIK